MLNIIAKGVVCLVGSTIADFNTRAIIYLDRPPYSSSNTYIMLNIITKGVACLVGSAIADFNI